MIAVIDATSWAERASSLDPSMVMTVARAIEEVLRAHAYARSSGGLGLVERLIEGAAGAAFLVESPGRIVRANARGRAFLERRGLSPSLPAWADLIEVSRRAGNVEVGLPGGNESMQMMAEAILDENGGVLALLVVVTESTRRSSAPAPKRDPRQAFAPILGSDPAVHRAREQCARLSRSELPIVLLAETGTGKELFARAIHESSPRAGGPYVAMNCGAIQADLLISELFGHGPGAFTGAARAGRDGFVAAAHGGTIFLDEVADLSMDAQVALLRVLEDGSYCRVGETQVRHADIRVIAATCRDLRTLVQSGAFREDLFFRIGGACVELPALRDREDFDELLTALWKRVRLPDGDRPAPLAEATRQRLAEHTWPGNVRELESVLEYAAVMAGEATEVQPTHLPSTLKQELPAYTLPAVPPQGALDDARRRSLVEALQNHAGNISAAARHLGVARSTVYRLAKRYGIHIDGQA
ncbi:MAG: sigma 54-interacting transcriptional regulator [Planctomycetota bacterium]